MLISKNYLIYLHFQIIIFFNNILIKSKLPDNNSSFYIFSKIKFIGEYRKIDLTNTINNNISGL